MERQAARWLVLWLLVAGMAVQAADPLASWNNGAAKSAIIGFIDDKAGKPRGIHQFIGRRPIFAAGNSDGDLQTLQWTTIATGPRMGLLVRHTDTNSE